jgi:hypothetical protein
VIYIKTIFTASGALRNRCVFTHNSETLGSNKDIFSFLSQIPSSPTLETSKKEFLNILYFFPYVG